MRSPTLFVRVNLTGVWGTSRDSLIEALRTGFVKIHLLDYRFGNIKECRNIGIRWLPGTVSRGMTRLYYRTKTSVFAGG